MDLRLVEWSVRSGRGKSVFESVGFSHFHHFQNFFQ